MTPPGKRIWLGALVQITVTTIFMLLFRFPKSMILAFAALILAGTAFSAWLKPRTMTIVRATSAERRPLSHPTLLRVVGFLIALCAMVFVSIPLFGFVIFMNSWNTWHEYGGQPHHEADFVVKRAYYQPHRKGNPDLYASGTVEENQEWMSLRAYLDEIPRSQAELDSEVPQGTSIHVNFYPKLKGRARSVVYNEVLPDEAARRTAMNALFYAPLGLAVMAGIIFLLSRLQRLCYAPADSALQVGAAAGN